MAMTTILRLAVPIGAALVGYGLTGFGGRGIGEGVWGLTFPDESRLMVAVGCFLLSLVLLRPSS